MKLRDYLFEVAPKSVLYELARRDLISPPRPLLLTYSVTAACRSLCRTCNIGRVYLKNPEIAKQDLTLEEVEKTFRSLGPIYFFNISGGEPFMRMDLAEIVRLAAIYLKPRIIHIPTNALAPRAIEKTTHRILDYMDAYLPASVPLSIKPSIDGIGDMHDYVRGVQGNFAKLDETIDRLLAIRAKRPRLNVWIWARSYRTTTSIIWMKLKTGCMLAVSNPTGMKLPNNGWNFTISENPLPRLLMIMSV